MSLEAVLACIRHLILKTMPNSWPTTHRLHLADSTCCVFGCRGDADSFLHCRDCSRLHGLLREVIGALSDRSRLGHFGTGEDP